MDDDGLAKLQRQLKLLCEQLLLLLAAARVPIIIKSDFTYRGALFVCGKLPDNRKGAVGDAGKLLRVDAYGCIDKGIFLRKSYRRAAAFYVAARINYKLDPGSVKLRQERAAVIVKGGVVLVGMSVKIHGFLLRILYNNFII